MSPSTERLDHRVIAGMIPSGSRVLDLGCGEGELMDLLRREKAAKVQGVDLNDRSIYQCVAKGLSVVHSDLDSGLTGFPDHCFDYVILNQSLQQVRNIDLLIKEAVRVGGKAIIGFPNFGVWNVRWKLILSGRMPVTAALPYSWFDTPNLRFLTIKDFEWYCAEKKLKIHQSCYLADDRRIESWPNLLAATAIVIVSSEGDAS
jgi:methionine biosynthesis protein MetW